MSDHWPELCERLREQRDEARAEVARLREWIELAAFLDSAKNVYGSGRHVAIAAYESFDDGTSPSFVCEGCATTLPATAADGETFGPPFNAWFCAVCVASGKP